jgi:hypothetical protein
MTKLVVHGSRVLTDARTAWFGASRPGASRPGARA